MNHRWTITAYDKTPEQLKTLDEAITSAVNQTSHIHIHEDDLP